MSRRPHIARYVLWIGSLLLSGFGLLLPGLFLAGDAGPARPVPGGIWLWAAMVVAAWSVWMWLGYHWARERRLRKAWPVAGLVLGSACLLIGFPLTLMLTLPAVIMGCVFVRYHLQSAGAGANGP